MTDPSARFPHLFTCLSPRLAIAALFTHHSIQSYSVYRYHQANFIRFAATVFRVWSAINLFDIAIKATALRRRRFEWARGDKGKMASTMAISKLTSQRVKSVRVLRARGCLRRAAAAALAEQVKPTQT